MTIITLETDYNAGDIILTFSFQGLVYQLFCTSVRILDLFSNVNCFLIGHYLDLDT